MKDNSKHTKPGMSFDSRSDLIYGTLAKDYRHLVALIMESERNNPFFRSPIGDSPQHILDIGTGQGTWAMYVCYLVEFHRRKASY